MALGRLAQEDPSFRVSTDQETGQTILKGMGELHLEIKVDILQAHLQGRRQCRRAAGRLSRDAHASRPRSTTRTRSRPAVRASSPASRSSSSRCRRARATASRARSSAARCRRNTSPASKRASRASHETGVLAGFPVIDFKATLIDGAYHEVELERAGLRNRGARRLQGRLARRRAASCSSRS